MGEHQSVEKRGPAMSVRSGIVIAFCLTLSLAAAGAALAAPPAQSDGSLGTLQAVRTPVGASAVWFPISFEPTRASGTDLLKPVDALVRSQTSSAPASQSQQEVQVPATVQNLRRADH
jgi:hypothetical protein